MQHINGVIICFVVDNYTTCHCYIMYNVLVALNIIYAIYYILESLSTRINHEDSITA